MAELCSILSIGHNLFLITVLIGIYFSVFHYCEQCYAKHIGVFILHTYILGVDFCKWSCYYSFKI